jgi:ankyrin repeat protein
MVFTTYGKLGIKCYYNINIILNMSKQIPNNKYTKRYSQDQIAANKAKKFEGSGSWGLITTDERKRVGVAMFRAAASGDAVELQKLVEPWFANEVLNDYSGLEGHWTPLHIASLDGHIECVKILAAQPGIEINKSDSGEKATALYLASIRGHVDIVEFLCSLPGIDVNKAKNNGDTPYSDACLSYSGSDKEERKSRIRTILQNKGAKLTRALAATIATVNEYKKSYNEAQIENNRAKNLTGRDRREVLDAIFKALYDFQKPANLLKLVEPWFAHSVLNDYGGKDKNKTPLMVASSLGNTEGVKILAAQPGIELNKISRDNGETALLIASLSSRDRIVQFLCSLPGIDVNKADIDDKTPLHWASMVGEVDIVKMLCSKRGINVNSEDKDGNTPYDVICHEYTGSNLGNTTDDIREILKYYGGKPTRDPAPAPAPAPAPVPAPAPAQSPDAIIATVNKYRRSYNDAEIAANKVKVYKHNGWDMTEAIGEKIFVASKKGDAAGLIKLVEDWFANPILNAYVKEEYKDPNMTPLTEAVANGRIECVRILAAQPGIDINQSNFKTKATPLLWASYGNKVDIVELLCSLPRIDVNKGNISGITPLLWASTKGYVAIAKLLCSKPEINVNQANIDGITPLHAASKNGHLDILELLCSMPKIDVNKMDNKGKKAFDVACDTYDQADRSEKVERAQRIRNFLKSKENSMQHQLMQPQRQPQQQPMQQQQQLRSQQQWQPQQQWQSQQQQQPQSIQLQPQPQSMQPQQQPQSMQPLWPRPPMQSTPRPPTVQPQPLWPRPPTVQLPPKGGSSNKTKKRILKIYKIKKTKSMKNKRRNRDSYKRRTIKKY